MRDTARTMWALFEPVHVVTYFAPQARAAFEAAGLRGFWRGYFAGRAAPFGPVGPGPVCATFFGFDPAMVRRALPDVWQRADPAAALAARLGGAREALAAVLAEVADHTVEQAAALLRRAATSADVAGRASGRRPWQRLGDEDTARLAMLLAPISTAARTYLPYPSLIGPPAPPATGAARLPSSDHS